MFLKPWLCCALLKKSLILHDTDSLPCWGLWKLLSIIHVSWIYTLPFPFIHTLHKRIMKQFLLFGHVKYPTVLLTSKIHGLSLLIFEKIYFQRAEYFVQGVMKVLNYSIQHKMFSITWSAMNDKISYEINQSCFLFIYFVFENDACQVSSLWSLFD